MPNNGKDLLLNMPDSMIMNIRQLKSVLMPEEFDA